MEAMTVYAENSDVIDLVVSDMIMPEKSGMELFSELQAIKPGIKFILVTGYYLEEAEGHVLRSMSAILMKPYTTEKIAALIRKVLDE
jgi:two-component system cell cycle sensor histidine kinase/response regulator CckA